MTRISNWAAVASVAIGLLAVGCTVTTGDDNTEGGASGSGGSGGIITTSDAGDAATVVITTDARTEAGSEAAAAVGACEACIQGNCAAESTACRADTVNGCAGALPDFYTCLTESTSSDSSAECTSSFTQDAQHPSSGAGDGSTGAGLANDLGACVMGTPCTESCRSRDGG